MKICILGLGVIGSTYGYAFQKAGHEVEHLVRGEKEEQTDKLSIHLLDGRYQKKGQEKVDSYQIRYAQANNQYDFILLSVRQGKIHEAVESLKSKNIQGTLIFFCNFWNTRDEIEQIADEYDYVIGFPTAGGQMKEDYLDCVLFDHLMLEKKELAKCSNYEDLELLFHSADLTLETPADMVEWIWIHMAINAGVTSTAASDSKASPEEMAINLMNSSRKLSRAVKTIRETLSIVEARGVNLNEYRGELLPYKIPAWLSGILMKRLFASNLLTRKIMTLHNDKKDILYGCQSLYEAGKSYQLNLSFFYENINKISL